MKSIFDFVFEKGWCEDITLRKVLEESLPKFLPSWENDQERNLGKVVDTLFQEDITTILTNAKVNPNYFWLGYRLIYNRDDSQYQFKETINTKRKVSKSFKYPVVVSYYQEGKDECYMDVYLGDVLFDIQLTNKNIKVYPKYQPNKFSDYTFLQELNLVKGHIVESFQDNFEQAFQTNFNNASHLITNHSMEHNLFRELGDSIKAAVKETIGDAKLKIIKSNTLFRNKLTLLNVVENRRILKPNLTWHREKGLTATYTQATKRSLNHHLFYTVQQLLNNVVIYADICLWNGEEHLELNKLKFTRSGVVRYLEIYLNKLKRELCLTDKPLFDISYLKVNDEHVLKLNISFNLINEKEESERISFDLEKHDHFKSFMDINVNKAKRLTLQSLHEQHRILSNEVEYLNHKLKDIQTPND